MSTYIISLTHDPKVLIGLQEQWEALQDRSSADGIYLSWEWVNAWWEYFGHEHELWLLQAHTPDGKLVGIAPLTLTSFAPVAKRLSMIKWRQLQLAGAGMGLEHLDLIIEHGFEKSITEAFINHLRKFQSRWDVLHVSGLCEGTGGLSTIKDCPKIAWEEEIDLVAPYIALPATWDEYFSGLSKLKRKAERRRMRDLDEQYPDKWALERITSPEMLHPTFDRLIELHQATWAVRGLPGAFYDARFAVFFRELSLRFLRRGWLRMYRLCLDGKIAAVLCTYEYRGRIYDFVSGVDYTYGDLGVGHVITQLAIKSAIETGIREYDFMWGNEPYKYDWNAVDRIHHAVTWYASWQGQIQKRFIDTAKDIKHTLNSYRSIAAL